MTETPDANAPGPDDGPPRWTPPTDPPPPTWGPPQPPPPQYGQPQYGQPEYGQPQYGQPQYGQPQYGQPQYGQPQYGQPQYGQPQYGQPPWGQPPGYGAPQAPKPGVIPLRPLGVGEILDGAITTMRANPKATFGLSAAFAVVTQLLQLIAFVNFTDSLESAAETGDFGPDTIAGSGAFIGTLLLSGIASTMLTGALMVIVGQAVLGRSIDLGETWRQVRDRFWPLLGASILIALIQLVAFALCVLPFFFVWPMLSLATPALMLERQSVRQSLRRSMTLVRPDFWRCLGIVLLSWLIATIVGAALELPFTLAGGASTILNPEAVNSGELDFAYLFLTSLGAIVATTVTRPFAAGMRALLYVDRRMRMEGLDVSLAAAAAAPTAGGMRPGGP